MKSELIITPRTKVAELLEAYPELEDVLIDLAPAFRKLKNPLLRKTIARVTSLQQAASVGEVPVEVIVNKLRGLVGQDELQDLESTPDYRGERPAWFDTARISVTFDAREMIATGGHPVSKVLGDLHEFGAGSIYELVTPFLPAPLIDKVKAMGFDCYTEKESESLFRNYFHK